MKTVKKNVYYCDFCKKKGLSAGHMREHEKHCTGNPNRICRMCDSTSMTLPKVVKNFKSRFKIVEGKPSTDYMATTSEEIKWIGKPITVDEISDMMDGCPACMLAAVRQSGMNHYAFINVIDIKYQERVKTWWHEKNREDQQRAEESTYY